MSSLKNSNHNQMLHEIDGSTAAEVMRAVESRMVRAIRQSGAHSFEYQTLKLQYRNLMTGVRMGLL